MGDKMKANTNFFKKFYNWFAKPKFQNPRDFAHLVLKSESETPANKRGIARKSEIKNVAFAGKSNLDDYIGLENEEEETTTTDLECLPFEELDLSAALIVISPKPACCEWFQLSGLPDCFMPDGHTILKKAPGADSSEKMVYEAFTADPALKELVPMYFGAVEHQRETYIRLRDVLIGFDEPSVMDIKLGTRTFLESEIKDTKPRPDLYLKMMESDANVLTEEEHELKAVTMLRYLQFRDQESSTSTEGFRIEAIKINAQSSLKDLETVKSRGDIQDLFSMFLTRFKDAKKDFLSKLKRIRSKIETNEFFKKHEFVGSSLLLIHDDYDVGVWLIDFEKVNPLPPGLIVNHRSPWELGNHEDGLLFGLDRLIDVVEGIKTSSLIVADFI